jgi:cytochrome c oxidase cbb3-type subunit 4
MDTYSTLSSLFTVVSFLTFVGIVAWAYGRRRQAAFAAAANEPFALPDEGAAGANALAHAGSAHAQAPADSGPAGSAARQGERR